MWEEDGAQEKLKNAINSIKSDQATSQKKQEESAVDKSQIITVMPVNTLKGLKSEFDSRIKNAKYVNSIKAECYFYKTGITEYGDGSGTTLLSLSQTRAPISCNIQTDSISSEEYKFSTGIKKIYPRLIEETSKIKVKNKIYANVINETLGRILGKTVAVSNSKKYVTSVSYKEEQEILRILDNLKSKLKGVNTKGIKKAIKGKIETPHIQVKVDQEGYWDSLGAIASSRSDYYQLSDNQQEEKYAGLVGSSKVTYPSISNFLNYLQKYRTEYSVYNENKFINRDLEYILEKLLPAIDKKIQEAIKEINRIKKKVKEICGEYNDLEMKNKKRYKGELEKAIANKDDKSANKAINKLKKLGLSKKKIKELIDSYAKKANMKVTYKNARSLSIKTIKKTSGSGGGSSTTPVAHDTGAKVVKVKTKTLAKEVVSKNILVGTTVLAATRNGIKEEIKRVKADAKAEIANARNKTADNKRLLEIAKNEKIADINRKGAEEIEAVDINAEDAQAKIDEIKTRVENEVNAINEQCNNDIQKVEQDLQTKIDAIEKNRDTNVQSLNKQLGKLKSSKVKSNVLKSEFESKVVTGATIEVASTSDSDVATSNEEMLNATGTLTDTYEEKSSAILEALNTSTIETSPDVMDNFTTESTSNNVNASITMEESVASPVTTENVVEKPTPTPTSSASSSNNHSNNYYVTNDDPREGITSSNATPTTEVTKDTGMDQSNTPSSTENGLDRNGSGLSEKEENIVSIAGSDVKETGQKSSSGMSSAIPIGLGIAATGAAAVAGVRYVKNRKQNEDIDDTYDDENNNLEEYEDIPSDSAYMRDDYLGPEGSSYTEVPDENSYTDTEELEEAAGVNGFSEDAALNDLT